MSSKAEVLVDAIVSHLAAGVYTQPVTVSKVLAPVYDRSELSDIRLDVYSGARAWERQSRSSIWLHIYNIGVVIRRPAGQTNTDISQLLELTDQVFDRLRGQVFSGSVLQEVEQDEPFKMDALLEEGKGFVELRLTYKGT